MNVIVRRRGESEKSIKLGKVTAHLLQRSPAMETMIVELPPGEEIPKVYSHKGEEVRIVLEGEIEVEVEGRKHLLRKGEFMWFNSKQKHRIKNSGNEKAVYFSANVPSSLEW